MVITLDPRSPNYIPDGRPDDDDNLEEDYQMDSPLNESEAINIAKDEIRKTVLLPIVTGGLPSAPGAVEFLEYLLTLEGEDFIAEYARYTGQSLNGLGSWFSNVVKKVGNTAKGLKTLTQAIVGPILSVAMPNNLLVSKLTSNPIDAALQNLPAGKVKELVGQLTTRQAVQLATKIQQSPAATKLKQTPLTKELSLIKTVTSANPGTAVLSVSQLNPDQARAVQSRIKESPQAAVLMDTPIARELEKITGEPTKLQAAGPEGAGGTIWIIGFMLLGLGIIHYVKTSTEAKTIGGLDDTDPQASVPLQPDKELTPLAPALA